MHDKWNVEKFYEHVILERTNLGFLSVIPHRCTASMERKHPRVHSFHEGEEIMQAATMTVMRLEVFVSVHGKRSEKTGEVDSTRNQHFMGNRKYYVLKMLADDQEQITVVLRREVVPLFSLYL
ncbi:hypothetical protein PoB_007018800 [Plakobranchus ocellatus]|uniref:Cystatin domain-containing protein n=1 Tax=Plakobranchus ocellatus TaxID=259542 RepID=A0AAV4DHB4_9GAST|nr:hypothetical protein PoB_007018800 [Plakobranchus ocellatus]